MNITAFYSCVNWQNTSYQCLLIHFLEKTKNSSTGGEVQRGGRRVGSVAEKRYADMRGHLGAPKENGETNKKGCDPAPENFRAEEETCVS